MPKKKFKKINKKLSYLQKNYLLYLSSLSLILVISTALSINNLNNKNFNEPKVVRVKGVQVETNTTDLPDIPSLINDAIYPSVSAEAVIAVDMDSGISMYEKNPNARFLPASTTKIMTALVAMDYYSLDTELVVERFSIEGQKMNLLPGERITVENLLYGLLIHSANDAAEVLARNYPGGREVFIDAMNNKAQDLNLKNTHFQNPSGLDGINHYSTAQDLVRVAAYAMQDPFFSKVVATKQMTASSSDGSVRHNLVNINQLIDKVEGVLGVKTGWTENARENLVTYLERDDRRVMIAVMGSQDRFGETKLLIDWIFDNYQWEEVQE